MSETSPLLSLAAWAARALPMPVKRQLYRVPALARLVRGALNRAAPEGLSVVTVAAGGLQGRLMQLDLQSEKDYWLGTYEPDLQAALADFIGPGMVVYDVGANIGYISLLIARRVGPGGQVYAFEALPANQERLRANLALGDGREPLTLVPAAVVEASRRVRFLIGPSGGMGKAEGSAGRDEYKYSDAVDVEGLSLDDFVYRLGNPPPQAIKLDIEGGEVLALPGMHRLLEDARPLVLMELHGPQAALAAWEAFSRAGYRICRMKPGYPGIDALNEIDWKAYLVAVYE